MNQLGLFAPSGSATDFQVSASLLLRIEDTYSGDIIAMAGRVKKPLRFEGMDVISVGGGTSGKTDCFALTPISEFRGVLTTYKEKTIRDGGEFARNDAMGFYHGMQVKCGGADYVLSGPELTFSADYDEYRAAWVAAMDLERARMMSEEDENLEDEDSFEDDYNDDEKNEEEAA